MIAEAVLDRLDPMSEILTERTGSDLHLCRDSKSRMHGGRGEIRYRQAAKE